MPKKTFDPATWLLGGIFAVLLAILGYVVTLSRDMASTKVEVRYLKEQMQSVAEYVGPLWLAHKRGEVDDAVGK